jgi:NAD+ kinase
MKFALVGKLQRGRVTKTAQMVLEFLNSKNQEVQVEREFARMLGVEGTHWRKLDADIIITVGGDGTILKTLEYLDGKVFGINEGRLGYLTEVEPEEAIQGLERILKEDFNTEVRRKLQVSLNGERLYDALNEAVIHTSVIAKMQQFEVRVDGQPLDTFRADGMIVATPTGSTGYSMSAGGPLMDPRVNGFIIVPIAPFKLSARAIVMSNECDVEVKLLEPKPSVMVLDGQYEKAVSDGDKITFTASEKVARFIRFKPSFYDIIRKHLD